MIMPDLKIFVAHGINTPDASEPGGSEGWEAQWELEIREIIKNKGFGPNINLVFTYLNYDALFDSVSQDHTFLQLLSGVGTALAGVWDSITGLFKTRDFDPNNQFKWAIEMVAVFLGNATYRQQLFSLVDSAMAGVVPDIILGHSLGSLIMYPYLLDKNKTGNTPFANISLLTFGSQIGSVYTTAVMGGGPRQYPGVKDWYHLWNRDENAFTFACNLNVADPRFHCIETTWNDGSLGANHDGATYIVQPAAISQAWVPMFTEHISKSGEPMVRAFATLVTPGPSKEARQPMKRALVIGIDTYPDPTNNLQGCVNDTFLISGLLQEYGFPASGIRLLVNDRATSDAIKDRFAWLVNGAQAGDQLVFHYSGHGAQIPGYGVGQAVDHIDEVLAPYNFAWSLETSVADETILPFYSSLPYGVSLTLILDCCHAGNFSRGKTGAVRGLEPPADIRHRILEWNSSTRHWQKRILRHRNPKLKGEGRFLGEHGATNRIGRAGSLRLVDPDMAANIQAANGNAGPYMPIIFEACRANESAEEYADGPTTNGAFTLSFVDSLKTVGTLTPRDVIAKSTTELTDRQINTQHPQVEGHSDLLIEKILCKRSVDK
jgi:hypothetical protein